MDLVIIILLLCSISLSSTSVVKWLPNKSFNLNINFDKGQLPCSKQTVVFPETIQESVRFDKYTSVNGFVLPVDGELILDEGVLAFGPNPADNCTNDGNIYYLDNSAASWAQPNVWSSEKYNKATPDAERIPCYDDIVVFPDTSQFSIQLPDRTQYVKEIKIGGRSVSVSELTQKVYYSEDLSQAFIANKYGGVGVSLWTKPCKTKFGCPCQVNGLDIDCSLKVCPEPTCVYPIQPIGHCCKICGGSIVFNTGRYFKMVALKEYIDNMIVRYGSDKLDYHIGRLPSNFSSTENVTILYDDISDNSATVQVIVVEKGEYTGLSAEAINEINYDLPYYTRNKTMMLSGNSLDQVGHGGKIAISMFFIVVLVIGGIYAYYYKLPQYGVSNLPEIFTSSSRSAFNRFQRRTESVVSLTRRDSAASVISARTAFRNPLYDSKRGRVQVAESIDTVDETIETED